MAGLPPDPNSKDETGMGPDRGSPPSTPRWVIVFGVVALVLVMLFVILHLTGGGFGPGSHTRQR